jgi:DNA-binding response OmpR family regulator
MRKKRILVVDDDRQILILMKNLLKEFRFDSLTASTGAEAIGLVERENLDLMLLDINLPDLRGEEVIAAVRSRGADRGLPIVVLSGEPLDRNQVRAMGADVAVQKPFDIHELRTTLERLLARERQPAGPGRQ